jgi:predicted ATPase
MSLPKSSVQTYRNGKLTTLEESQEFFVPIFTINKNKLYSNQLSEGTFRSLALIFYILNHKSNILIIEEPELSVHLELLTDIIELIKDASKTKQIILSTHSEKIINMLDYKNISVVSRSDDGIGVKSLPKILNESKIKSIDGYIADGGSLAEILFSEV